MHEIGDAVFNTDDDNIIDSEDAIRGIFVGSQVIGNKYIEPKVLSTIKSEKYQTILKKISEKGLGYRFTRQGMISKLNASEKKVLDNFLRKMEHHNVLIKHKEHGPGHYRFTSEIYHMFFFIQPIFKQIAK